MKVLRPVVIVVILLNAAILAVQGPLASLCLRYEVATRQAERQELERERRELLLELSRERRWERLTARALQMGIDLESIGSDRIVESPETDPARTTAVGVIPRR